MIKANFSNLVIEITRRCNMNCAHCMRGDAQDKDITAEIIDKLLKETSAIGSLTLTGGEVALNVPAIKYIAKRIRDFNTPVQDIFIATNGKQVTNDFLQALLDLFLVADIDEEINTICISHDEFHEDIPEENIKKLKMFRFYNEQTKTWDFRKGGLINLGRARNLTGYTKRNIIRQDVDAELDEDELTFNSIVACTVDGELLSDCDYEYCDTDSIKIGAVDDPNWAKTIANKFVDME